MRKFKPAMYVKHNWWNNCAERNALLDLINHSSSPTIRKPREPQILSSITFSVIWTVKKKQRRHSFI